MSEARQRWRLIVARDEAARELAQREVTTAWETAFRASGLPIAETDGAVPRPRIAYGAPVPVGMLAAREPIDVALFERRRIHEVREAIERVAPAGHRLVDLYDMWSGSPTLAGSIVAGEYRATVGMADGTALDPVELDAALRSMLDADRITSRREKGGAVVEVDIRPHILELRMDRAADGTTAGAGASGIADDGPVDLLMRLRLGGEGGVGRPDEVVAALGARLERTLTTRAVTRELVILADGPA